ncbi:MAG: SoxR reducing system RseC family protein [Bacteroidales bacterium]|nr:SoxR reducing system RseC family protein [Bacteroidales bacterium]
MNQIATHDGKVIAVEPYLVRVEMHVVSACSSCKAHEKCAFVDKDDKVVEVETPDWKEYHEGDTVIVSVNEGLGLLAVLLAYFLPAVLLIAAVVVLSLLTKSEALAAVIPIALIAIYFIILYKLRDSLQRKFTFGIRKVES